MVTVILFALTIALILAAGYVGLLILRRSRPTLPDDSDDPQTVGDLVRGRSAPPDDLADKGLFAPKGSRRTAPAGPKPADGPAGSSTDTDGGRTPAVSVPQPTAPSTATPPGGVEAGDAPWRRAARMMGAEPGGAWETAPLPVVAEAPAVAPSPGPAVAPATAAATARPASSAGSGRTGVVVAPSSSPGVSAPEEALASPAVPTAVRASDSAPDRAAVPATAGVPAAGSDAAGRTAVIAVPRQGGAAEPASPAPATPSASGPATPSVGAPAPAGPDPGSLGHDDVRDAAPAGPALAAIDRPAVDPPANDAVTANDTVPDEPASGADGVASTPEPPASVVAPAAPAPDVSDRPSRPLSDPEMTPLMGIPIVRPATADDATPPSAVPAPAASDLVVREPDGSADAEPDPVAAITGVGAAAPVPVPSSSEADDDEVVWLQSAVVDERPAAVTGSPQPVWFRVVDRDGAPVVGAVVSLLDDHGHEADATKTATDGGGELHAPHGGRFLMIAGADRFQPRAALLTVEEQPVEIALLLPRSSGITGVVRAGDAPLAQARVIAVQEGEVVDELVTDPGGGYRFDDLAEGAYAVFAAHARGGARRTVRLSPGADLRLDLDLVPPDGAR